MQSQKVTGIALVLGALTMIAAIALHPHHGSAESAEGQAARNLIIAVVVLASYGILGVGFTGLLRLMAPQPWKDVAGVALTFAGVCGALAGITGHVAVPRLIAQVNAADETEKAVVRFVIASGSASSEALAQTSFAAWAIGAACLSIVMMHRSAGWRIVGAWGLALGFLILLALGWGRLQISLHNVGLVVLGSAIWLIAIGSRLAAPKSFVEPGAAAP